MDSVVSDAAASSGYGVTPLVDVETDDNLKSWQTDRTRAPVATKIVVAGGFGVGKTTLVTAASEITPLQTEALMTEASEQVDDLTGTPEKVSTTVAMDYGRITLDDDLVRGAIGAVVLADTRRLKDCFPALDYFDGCGMPYVVAVNHFDGSDRFEPEDVREALTIPAHIPVMIMDARRKISVIETLLSLVGHALDVTPE